MLKVGVIVLISEEYGLPIVSPLDDMLRNAGQVVARLVGHAYVQFGYPPKRSIK